MAPGREILLHSGAKGRAEGGALVAVEGVEREAAEVPAATKGVELVDALGDVQQRGLELHDDGTEAVGHGAALNRPHAAELVEGVVQILEPDSSVSAR